MTGLFNPPDQCPIKGCAWSSEDSESAWPEHRDEYHDGRSQYVGCGNHETWQDGCTMCIMNEDLWVNKAAYDAMGSV